VTAPRAARAGAATACALAVAACGPYADVGQKLDVTTPITGGDTWIAAEGTEIRVLVIGKVVGEASAEASFTSMQMPISAGVSAFALQGKWSEDPGAGTATFRTERRYTLPDERSASLLARRGVWREDVRGTLQLTATVENGRLVLAGDPSIAGTYVPFRAALARLGTTTARDAACAFEVANVGIRSSEVRIIGFGGPGMTQYQTPATYVGIVGGTLRVAEEGFLNSTTTITYAAFEDLGGARVDGPQMTRADSSGDGHMSGTLTISLEPLPPGGAAGAPVIGTIDYGGGGVSGDAVQISDGTASGGFYVVSLQGGGSAKVSPVAAPSPSVAECLALP
jgi:hypothetical protein